MALLSASGLAAWPAPAAASEPTPLRVGTSGDYAPFSELDPGGALVGFDLALAQAFAADAGLLVVPVRFAWPDLPADLAAGRFDLAFSGVTVRADRSLVGRFSAPVLESGAVALVPAASALSSLDDLDAPGVTIAVNGGGHLERAARARFPRARLLPQPANDEVPGRVAAGAADAAITDVWEAPRWRARIGGARVLGPFTRDRKAALVRADRPDLSERLDAWLLAREADGTLAALRGAWLGREAAAGPATAAPLPALLAALDERLSLMPWVAAAKARAGRPLVDRAQEERVIEAAVRAADAAAAAAGTPAPPAGAVRELTEAWIQLALRVQERSLAAGATEGAAGAPPDLDTVLRPAVARASARIAFFLVRLGALPDEASLVAAAREALRAPHVAPEDAPFVASALARYARSSARATSPAITGSASDTP